MTTKIGLKSVKVKASDGEKLTAQLNFCTACGNASFNVYKIIGDVHEHYQCANETCGVVYCHGTGHCGGKEMRS